MDVSIFLAADTPEEKKEWVSMIEEAIRFASGLPPITIPARPRLSTDFQFDPQFLESETVIRGLLSLNEHREEDILLMVTQYLDYLLTLFFLFFL